MRFLRPEILWLLLALPLVALAGVWSVRRRAQALGRFAGGAELRSRFEGQVSPHQRAAKLLLRYLALVCLVIAAARPQWGARLESVTRHGADVMILLDTSLSMAAEDLAPSRLDLARHEADTLLRRLDGDRVGLVTFAGQASPSCPLTLDHAAVRLFLEAEDVRSVPVPGTALAEALRAAMRGLGQESAPGEERTRALVLFTDGEDHEGGIDDVLPELRDSGVAVYAVGCGTTRGGPIPEKNAAGVAAGYKTDREGKVVTTRLDEAGLERLALETGGRYYRATAGGLEVDEIARAIQTMDTREFGTVLRSRYEERYQIPLTVALLALLVEALLGDRRRRVGLDVDEVEPREAKG